ncbi:ATP-binding protein [Spirulina sp. CS-785/01]|uniref:ATP-binding protein n=1 Tax=Spirulina sp. CS-785/01 TaxID=3021716 RepID=UPI00232E4BE2|nr:ATP-binding protein [Spirulina sp. CS-785/01]
MYIRNCGVFSNHLIDFTQDGIPQDLICLSGVNGSGKTTILELIFNLASFLTPRFFNKNRLFFDRLKPHILTRTEFAQLDLIINENKLLSLVFGEEEEIQYDKKYEESQCFVIVSEEIKSIIQNIEDTIVKSPEEEEEYRLDERTKRQFIRFLTDLTDKEFDTFQKERNIRNQEILNDFFKAIEEHIEKEINYADTDHLQLPYFFLFNSHDREILDIRYTSLPKNKSTYNIVYSYNPKRDDLEKLLVFYNYAYPERYESLVKWINKHILSDQKIEKINKPDFQVVMKTKQGKEHGIELLSSGEESLLILAIQIYLKASQNSIILIDEIDQSLHPEFQEKAIKMLRELQREKGCQIVVTSHSDIIWNAFEEKSIIRLTEVLE